MYVTLDATVMKFAVTAPSDPTKPRKVQVVLEFDSDQEQLMQLAPHVGRPVEITVRTAQLPLPMNG